MLKRISAGILFLLFISFPFTTVAAARMKYPPRRERQQPCKVQERWWLGADYLFWRFNNCSESVPLVVEGPPTSSRVVLGGKNIENDWRSGGKVTLGYWFDPGRQLGGEVSYLFLLNKTDKKVVSSDGSPGSAILSVPYFDVVSGKESFAGVALPGVFKGTARLNLSNCMNTSEANIIAVVPESCSTNVIWIAGLRYWGFEESLSLNTDSPFIPPFPADVYQTKDHFRTENHFYGGQLGVRVEYTWNGFFANMQIKAAAGKMHQKLVISGKLLTNDFNDFGPVEEFKGGYFTMPSNIKTRTADRYSIIPEACVTIGYRFTDRFKFQLGYTALYVNNVLRPGREISRKINPTQSAALSSTPNPMLKGEALPKPSMKSSSFYAQGVNAGFEFTF
jgi:Putative beta barrel porin-7 (BBP7)